MIERERITNEIDRLRNSSQLLFECIERDRILSPEYLQRVTNVHSDFAIELQGGRGDSYRRAQIDASVRAVGIEQLLRRILQGRIGQSHTVLDVLGGDGVVARAAQQIFPEQQRPFVITSDIDAGMVEAARAYGLPAVWQPAEWLIMRDKSMDGVLMAYGSHHIEPANRQQAVNEAFRVLKPGGQFVLHDFEEGSPVADWFTQVVDRYSITGHRYVHFTHEEMLEFLTSAGFTNIFIGDMYDPFICTAPTPNEAADTLGDYLLNMYGLVKLREICGEDLAKKAVLGLAFSYFVYDNYSYPMLLRKQGTDWYSEMPRVALVASGTKP